MDAIVLVGGMGTRLQKVVSDVPKPLAPINGNPFLNILLTQLSDCSLISHVILASGYKREQIATFLEGHSYPFRLSLSEEHTPLGTGGAVKQAYALCSSEDYFVLNGDSYLELDFTALYTYHTDHAADLTMACRHVEDVARYGEVVRTAEGNITHFKEKASGGGEGWINGGIYVIRRGLPFPDAAVFSIEQDFFPTLLKKRLFGYPTDGKFIDIGTEASYKRAQEVLACNRS